MKFKDNCAQCHFSVCGRQNNVQPPKISTSNLKTDCYLMWQKGLCRCEYVKDCELGGCLDYAGGP